ncbi:MAG: DUF3866 family protein [Firmicutes bacterium]|nr:DUF3866 family protein [Bacillota bacterium]
MIVAEPRPLGRVDLRVRLPGGEEASAVAYPALTGPVAPGDRVLLNTTAVRLGLGTGGRHFVMAVEGRLWSEEAPGHIMKLRYTPWQRSLLHVEEEGGSGHDLLRDAACVSGQPVVALGLHSQLEPVVRACRLAAPRARVVYVHTDGAALPVAFSDTVAALREEGLLAAVIATGQAFGGDAETVALPSALLAAALVFGADVIVAGMGPGIAGTGTRLGHSGTEQAWIAAAARALGGRPIVVPRLSAADPRARHTGLSHHTLAVLESLLEVPVWVAWPHGHALPAGALAAADAAFRSSAAVRRHLRVHVDLDPYWESLAASSPGWSTMRRPLSADPLPFAAAAAAGLLAAGLAAPAAPTA